MDSLEPWKATSSGFRVSGLEAEGSESWDAGLMRTVGSARLNDGGRKMSDGFGRQYIVSMVFSAVASWFRCA